MGAWLRWVFGLEIGTKGGYELGFCYGRFIVKILDAVDVIPLGTCDGTVLGFLEGFVYQVVVGKFEGLLLGNWIVSIVRILPGFNEVTKLVLWYGKVLNIKHGALVGI